MKDIDAQRILEAYEAVDPETGERMSPDKHAKAVQWTKDIKAKLAQAQKIGDSKEANKLQRYLDMHGIDEADDKPYDGMDDIHRGFENRELTNKVDVRIREVFNGEFKSLDEWLIKQLSELKTDAEAYGKDAEVILDGWINRWIKRALLQEDADR